MIEKTAQQLSLSTHNAFCPLIGLEFLVREKLSKIQTQGRWRELSTYAHSSADIDLTHNDYLGLRFDKSFLSKVRQRTATLPVASGGSRLLGGEHPIFPELERSFSEFKAAPSSLFFPSGFAANEGLSRVLGKLRVGVISDSLNHASIIDGIRGARLESNQKYILRHNALDHLKFLLKSSPYDVNLVFTESLFSMDGDKSPLKEMKKICDRLGGVLVVDEAHALGVYGSHGQGLIDECGLDHREVISINPCGKGMGASGAFVSGPSWVIDLLVNTAREFIYTTAPSPWIAAALLTAIEQMPDLHSRRYELLQKATFIREEIAAKGWDTAGSSSQIVPVVIGTESLALKAQDSFLSAGVLTKAIRPPTVPEGTCRLRFSLNWNACNRQFDRLVRSIKEVRL